MIVSEHDRVIAERKERIQRMEQDIEDAKQWLKYCYDRNCSCWEEYYELRRNAEGVRND